MTLFRWIAYSIPQVLILLLVGGQFDLLFGLNHIDAGFSILILFFILSPFMSAFLMATELVIYVLQRRRAEGRPSFRMAGLSIFLMIEAFALDVFILSQAKM